MKILLCDHVEHLGERGEIVTVAAGYARNYLLPKRLAMLATAGNMRALEQQRRVWEAKESRKTDEARKLADHIGSLKVSIEKKSGESGTLYGSVTRSEIAALVAAKGVEIDRRKIVLDEQIKSSGRHEVSIKLHRQVTGTIHLEVVAEAGASEE